MKSRFLPLAIFLLAASVLLFVVDYVVPGQEDLVRQVIVTPILYVFWVVTLLFSSVPQVLYWAAFIIGALVIARLSVPRGRPARPQEQAALPGDRGSVADWTALLRLSQESVFSRRSLAQALRRLSRELIFPGERVSYHEFETQFEQTSSALPTEIVAYFQAPMPEIKSRFWPGRRLSGSDSRALDLDPQHVVAYLENRLDPLAGE